MANLDERIAKIEGSLEQVNPRLNHIETDLRAELYSTRDSLRAEIHDLRNHKMRFYWLLGIMVAMWVSIILAVLFRG